MIVPLQELPQYIRETVPQSKSISHLQVRDNMQAATFKWQGQEFLVKPNLEVFEMKNNNVFITGASMLLQLVLLKRDRNQKIIEGLLESLHQVEDLITTQRQTQSGLKLLTSIKATVKRLAGR